LPLLQDFTIEDTSRDMKTEFEKAKAKADRRGYKLPPRDETVFLGEQSWMNYWAQCEEYESNPNAGRPVAPHRSA